MTGADWSKQYDIVSDDPVTRVEPKDLEPGSWLHEERFAEFVAAYQFATSHFSPAAVAFSKVTPEDAYWIHKTITTALERNRRVADERREEGR